MPIQASPRARACAEHRAAILCAGNRCVVSRYDRNRSRSCVDTLFAEVLSWNHPTQNVCPVPIARDIHDGLGHYLTTIHMQIQTSG
jgi:hypothetical protein